MLSIKVLLLVAISCVLLQQLDAACVCSEKGTDYCRGCSEHRVIRPKQKYYEKAELDLAPIGDNCWCSKQMIEPASLPKPCPKHKTKSCGCKSKNSYTDSSLSSSSYPSAYAAPAKPQDDSPAADPISVSLAVQAGHAIGVPEAKLAYGYVQKPVDGMKKVYFSSVPEENLHKLKNDIITLQKRPQAAPKEDEEWMEVEEDDEEPADEDEPPRLTYKQLGYVTETFKNPKFRKVKSTYVYADEPEDRTVPEAVKVDCGFKPGRISPYRKIKPDTGDCYEKY